ncbi:hypothetical protein LLE49_10355 [Alicyclobacillus tolerans]|uniref:hypothetical protein n=1 Tax=Alicyclobacillus tolerans TaxID=90970 RepID=UPI001F39A9E6|nr:hypothetical protein [Alicyclobacillus tolerans]MCF8565115.1 hypothetical protein [Alicyclobacillus tolerans]
MQKLKGQRNRPKDKDQEANASVTFILLVISGVIVLAIGSMVILQQNQWVAGQKYWIINRASAISAYVVLSIVVVLGNILSNPRNKEKWRLSRFLLPWHQALMAAMFTLIAEHLLFVAVDPKSGILPSQLWFPIHAKFTPGAMVAGAFGLYAMLLIGLTAGFRKWVKKWLPIHRIAIVSWVLLTFHGFVGGSDTPSISWMYLACALFVLISFWMRHWFSKKINRAALPGTQSYS